MRGGLQQRLYLSIQILDLYITFLKYIVLVYQEESWNSLNVVVRKIDRLCAVLITHADPRQYSGLRLPKMLIGIYRYLIYFKTPGMIFIIKFA